MNLPADLKYAATHEWARLEDGLVVVGISDPAQDMLGDVVFAEVPVGVHLQAGEVAGNVESVKAASDVHAPVAGEVVAFNPAVADDPGQLNSDPYGTWLFKLRPIDPTQLDGLLSAQSYQGVVDAS